MFPIANSFNIPSAYPKILIFLGSTDEVDIPFSLKKDRDSFWIPVDDTPILYQSPEAITEFSPDRKLLLVLLSTKLESL